MNKDGIIWGSILLGIALIISSIIFGFYLFKSREKTKTIKVVGSAKKEYTSNMVKWKITLQETVDIENKKEGYKKLTESRKKLEEILVQNGISTDAMNFKPVNILDKNDNKGVTVQNIFNQQVYIISKKVDIIEKLALNPEKIFEADIFIKYSNLEYFNTDVDEIKKELLSSATANAKERAIQMLKNTNINIKKILSVRSGVFQITEPYSTRVSSYGMYDTSTRKKEITVTVHTEFIID
ncbi:MAG: SIMPL domain-containing protein [Fusobacteriota bacterium]